jgi:hypothetical protein
VEIGEGEGAIMASIGNLNTSRNGRGGGYSISRLNFPSHYKHSPITLEFTLITPINSTIYP